MEAERAEVASRLLEIERAGAALESERAGLVSDREAFTARAEEFARREALFESESSELRGRVEAAEAFAERCRVDAESSGSRLASLSVEIGTLAAGRDQVTRMLEQVTREKAELESRVAREVDETAEAVRLAEELEERLTEVAGERDELRAAFELVERSLRSANEDLAASRASLTTLEAERDRTRETRAGV